MTAAAAAARARAAPDPALLPRLIAGARAGQGIGLSEHVERYGVLPRNLTPSERARLLDLVDASGLTGRGGAFFPTGRKLRAVAEAGRRPVVVANAVEGEPASGKDKVLLRCVPHLVLDGAALAAATVGAEVAVVALSEAALHERAALERALAERGRSRLGNASFRIALVPDRFVAGEETALVNVLNGGPAKPTFTPPRPFERGVRGRPTLVQNVETLANLALIARFGPAWFRAVGTEQEPGSVLVTVGGAIGRPGVYEVPIGLPVGELLAKAGGAREQPQALLVGGYFGSWVSSSRALSLPFSDAGLRAEGASLGARTVLVLPEGCCGVVETARLLRYLAGQSAGQCGPCVHGLDAVATAFEELARPSSARPGGRRPPLERWIAQVRGRGACRHPDGAAGLAESALDVFAGELERHARGRCTGGGRSILELPGAGR